MCGDGRGRLDTWGKGRNRRGGESHLNAIDIPSITPKGGLTAPFTSSWQKGNPCRRRDSEKSGTLTLLFPNHIKFHSGREPTNNMKGGDIEKQALVKEEGRRERYHYAGALFHKAPIQGHSIRTVNRKKTVQHNPDGEK